MSIDTAFPKTALYFRYPIHFVSSRAVSAMFDSQIPHESRGTHGPLVSIRSISREHLNRARSGPNPRGPTGGRFSFREKADRGRSGRINRKKYSDCGEFRGKVAGGRDKNVEKLAPNDSGEKVARGKYGAAAA